MKTNAQMLLALLLLGALGGNPNPLFANEPAGPFQQTGTLESQKLKEASGMQAGAGGVFFVHNDDGKPVLFITDANGRDLGSMTVKNAKNKDWEDITKVPGENGPLLVIADSGNKKKERKKARLYFLEEPAPGAYGGDLEVAHRLKVNYPDGRRDVEAVAYDPSGNMILFLNKRTSPPRLYGVPLDKALSREEIEAEFLAEVPGFRPPTAEDLLKSPRRGLLVSQPTGMDISDDGRLAAVMTYRSLYIFQREEGETWAEAFQRKPVEHVGPPGLHDEAVTFGHDQQSIYITTERRPAPVYRLDLPDGK
jgi:hypothetical protein